MRSFIGSIAVLAGPIFVLAGCSSEDLSVKAAAQDPPTGFRCTGAPSVGSVTPTDLPLPTAAQDGKGSYTTGSVSGPTSWFGGPAGGASGPFTLTSQWQDVGQEMGDTPCNDATEAGQYRSYFAAMRFSPEQFQTPPD